MVADQMAHHDHAPCIPGCRRDTVGLVKRHGKRLFDIYMTPGRKCPAGQIGIAGANYGTTGQVLTSGGASGAITWAAAAAGATGGGSDEWALEHDNTITTTYTIATGKNVISAGPLSINAAATITVPANSFWVVV